MSEITNEQYNSFLERLVRITHMEPFDREAYVDLITEICYVYGLAKGVTEFYPTPMMEQRGTGEIFCDFDNGKGDKVLIKIRIVSSSKAVIIATLYVNSADEEKSEDEIMQLDTMLRVIMGFVARRRLIRKLEEFGFSDLDGYNNFRAFARYIDIANAENQLGGKAAFHIDLHNFTVVNQEVGRDNGDIVLKNYYKRIQEAIYGMGVVARLGGDKFIGVYDRVFEEEIYKIFSGIPIPYDSEGKKRVNVSAAAGIYILPIPFMMKGYGDIMDKIMMAGNIAKQQAESGIVVYDDTMKERINHLKKVQADFKIGLKNEEFAVFYQPKVDIINGVLIGAEALCRWIQDDKIIPPMSFIPILEMNTDICDLDFYMLEHVCQHLKKWIDEGREAIRVSVNFSRKHLVDVDLVDHIIEVIDKYKVPHEYIEIELTETTTDVLFSDLRRVVRGLQEQGIWTAVDDFGVGYSSLNLICEIPWNVLKVDKSIVPVDEAGSDSTSHKMFAHVISLAHDIGLKCVIEGVETGKQMEILKKNNCRIVQGYYFDKPLPLEEFETRIDRKTYEV
ncbi:MAG: EAL domain-containing protein [Lachnospiraceae bacterium]|nr:EAL domain-containing protein [Lachnospiraceae bacterium]